MLAMCQAAVEKGIREIGFSEHLDLFPEDLCYASFRVEAWWEELAREPAMPRASRRDGLATDLG